MNNLSFIDQLQYLRGMTIRVNAIHEAQKNQMIWYGYLIKGIKEVTVKIDTDKKIVFYECRADSFRNSKSNKALYKNIDKWIKLLLWPETTVIININDKVLHDSRS